MDAAIPSIAAPHGRGEIAAALEDASAGYGEALAFAGLSLDLRRGEILVLMGPNGAGKTTLVRLLTGALAPRSGRVRRPAAPGGVQLVPQEVALWPWLSVAENCVAFARMAGLDRREARRRAGEALALAGCAEVADAAVERLSGGFKRRANIAAALIGRPEVLVLDEPTAGLDLEARRAVAAVVGSLKRRGLAVLVVTHDFAEAEAMADRVAILRRGGVARVGRPGDLIADAFGARVRVSVALAAPPGPGLRDRLRELDAAPGEADTDWSWTGAPDDWDARALVADLAGRGAAVREVSIRSPGLQALYERLVAA